MNRKTFSITIYFLLTLNFAAQAQPWKTVGNTLAGGEIFGSLNGFPVNIYTGGVQKASWTVSTGIPAGLFGAAGDGLRIWPNTPGSFPLGYLDMWTSTSVGAANETHIKWDGSGQIGGSGGWFRAWSSAGNGFQYNLTKASGRHIFNRLGNETARNGLNDYWKIGPAAGGDAIRRLEVVETISTPQLRLSLFGLFLSKYTDFETTIFGYQKIYPQNGRVGINLSTSTLVQPTHILDVGGDVRIENVPTDATPDFLLLGNPFPTGAGANDLEVQKLAFSGITTDVLLGDGTWGTISSGTTLGNLCTDPQNFILGDYEIPLNDFNFHFSDNGSSAPKNNVGIGTPP